MKIDCSLTLVLLFALPAHGAEPAYLGPANCRIANPAPVDGARAMWTGACKAGSAEGKGALQWYLRNTGGDRFEGSVERGLPLDGLMTYANGAQYEGAFRDGRRDGKGVMEYPNGDRYDGSWKDGLRDGRGTLLFALGGRYDGEWKDGRWQGRGALTFAGGRRVDGQFQAGALVGQAPRAELPTQRYVADTGPSDSGSNLPQRINDVNEVPADASYTELTPAQQALIRARYPLLDDDDEPPYPVNGSRLMFKWLQDAQRTLPPAGLLKLSVQVDIFGKPGAVTISGAPDPRLAQLIKVIMLNQQFKPALCRGKPCPMRFPLIVELGARRAQ
ncbi:MAG: hypothetical protein V4508_17645 [Pseudomonadota bacterium]